MFFKIYLNAPLPWQLGFQDPATAIMEGTINFHHDLFFFLVVILFFVIHLLTKCLYYFSKKFQNWVLCIHPSISKNTLDVSYIKRNVIVGTGY
jgi:heme/copper-type cytochrome/quinol oxidase subunit 2